MGKSFRKFPRVPTRPAGKLDKRFANRSLRRGVNNIIQNIDPSMMDDVVFPKMNETAINNQKILENSLYPSEFGWLSYTSLIVF